MKNIITLFVVLASLTLNAKDFYKAKITLATNEVIEGYAELPSNKILDGSVKFKEAEKGKTKSYKNDDINNIMYYTDKGNTFYFERINIRILLKSFGKVRERTTSRKEWILMQYYSPAINVYSGAQMYFLTDDDVMVSKSVDYSGTWAEVLMLFKRPGEEVATQIGPHVSGSAALGQDKIFRNTAIAYFEGEAEFVKRIEDKEFKTRDILNLGKAYAEYKSK